MSTAQTSLPCDFAIFGGTGDLAIRKLLPALYLRDRDGQLDARTQILAVARSGLDEAGYRDKIAAELPRFVAEDLQDASTTGRFLRRVHFVSIDFTEPSDFRAVRNALPWSNETRVFYLSCAPDLFGGICEGIGRNGLVDTASRVVLEKPIGRDLASARAINDAVGAVFDERQIFRIDHYLGKETVQNLLVTRFANTLLEPLWNSSWIDHIQITVAEALGVGGRGSYYDQSGALRDMLQNHLLQVLCLVAMEPPTYINRDTVRDEKLKVLQALSPLNTEASVAHNTVTGQYTAGSADNAEISGYGDEVAMTDSKTETFVAIKAEINNWRWAGVPFYLRTGKRMSRRHSEIVVQFKPVPLPMFPGSVGAQHPNRLVITLQPDEEMRLELTAKEPGPGGILLRPVSLALNYSQAFENRSPDAYERLLMDVVRGDPTLFMRRDEVEAAWAWVEPILRVWEGAARDPRRYPAGTDGPIEAATLLERDGRRWNEGAP